MNYTTKQLAKITNSDLIGNPNLLVEDIVFDSRNIFSKHNTAFIAITTNKNSGEKYINQVIEKGITVIITENQLFENENITWIITENCVNFLQKLAKYHLEQFPNLKTIGITGSNGKTIVKEWLYQCLSENFSVVKSPKSFNSQIGLPLSILKTKAENEVGIFEVGISQPNEMQILQEILHPKIGILTHIGSAHSANFKNEKELISKKLDLFKDSETIIFNNDNELINNEINKLYLSKNLISFGLNPNNYSYIENSNSNDKELIFVIGTEKIPIPVQQRDQATLSNALCVATTLKFLGFSNEKIIEKINNLKAIEMRLESVMGNDNNLIINDSYNLDIDSLKIAFQFINEYKKGKKILILTDFVDCKNPENFYPEIMKLTNDQKFDKIYLIGKEISKFSHKLNTETFTFNNTEELIKDKEFNTNENSLILIKGARKFETEKIKNHLQLQKHDTVLEVDLNAILHNINVHKSYLKPETKMMAMVKAFSYGTGGYEIAEFLQHHHIDYLGVAYADEGITLRKNGITIPIMVMNPEQHSYDAIIDYKLEPEIYSFRVLNLLCKQLQEKGVQENFPIHIKLETGMHRLGFKENELNDLIEILKTKNLVVKSIFSHLSTADIPEEKDYAFQQLNNFERMSSKLIDGLDYNPIRHILNSSGISTFPEFQYDMVRIGIGMYGISYDKKVEAKLQNVVTYKTLISQISEIEGNESISYGRKFKTNKRSRIATIPVGYADGIPRLLGNGNGKLKINDSLVPIVGTICMDMLMLDLGNTEAKEGDEVIIFDSIKGLENFAKYAQTIPYEILATISRRVKRIYIKN